MSDIQITLHRFDFDETWGMDPQPNGEWVRFEEVLETYRQLAQHIREHYAAQDAERVADLG